MHVSLCLQERDKFYMSRIVVLELLQALKFKSPLPDTNVLLLVQVTTHHHQHALLCVDRNIVVVENCKTNSGSCYAGVASLCVQTLAQG